MNDSRISKRRRFWRALGAAALSFAVPQVTSAQEIGPQPEPPPSVVRQPGEYSGVKPGEPVPMGRKRANTLTWIGFQPSPSEDGSARLFIQLTSEISYSQTVRDGKLIIRLDGARFHSRNTARRLDVRFFNSALRQVLLKRVGKRRGGKDRPEQSAGIEVQVSFKDASAVRPARATLQAEKDGYHYLLLDFDAAAGGTITVSEPDA